MKHPEYARRSLLSVLLFTAASAVQAADPAQLPTKNPLLDDARDNLREIRDLENSLREEAVWSIQKAQQEKAENQPQNQEGSQQETAAESKSDVSAEQIVPKNDTTVAADTCLNYTQTAIEGMTLIDAEPFRAKLSKCVTEDLLNELSRDITAAYIEAGYLHTKIDFKEEKGGLTIKVTEGRIREITGGSRTVNVDMLFPKHRDRPISVNYLDQGIEQANKLGGNNVSMDIYPHDDGTATISLTNQSGKNWFGSLTVDNRGSKDHRAVARVQVGVDSPLGLSDNLYVGGHSNIRHGNGYFSRGANVFYSVPYGAWTFSANASVSDSRTVTEFGNRRFAYDSKSVGAGVKAERMMYRSQKHILSAYGSFDYLSNKATFGGSRLALQSPKLATVETGITYSQTLPNGIWVNDIGVEFGTRALGAKDDPESPFTARYTRFGIQSNLVKSRRLGTWFMRNQHRLSAQYSGTKNLYSTKEFTLSDRAYVRGFKDLSLSGHTGVSVSNNLFLRKTAETGHFVEPYAGVDTGIVKDGKERYRGTGVALGVNIGYKQRWQFTLESARGFYRGRASGKKREEQITASFRVSF